MLNENMIKYHTVGKAIYSQKQRDNMTNNDPQNILHIKLKIEQHESHKQTSDELSCTGRVSSSRVYS